MEQKIAANKPRKNMPKTS